MSIHGICFDNGQSGDCDMDCEIFLYGKCENPEEFNNWLEPMLPYERYKTIARYNLLKLYPGVFDCWIDNKTELLKFQRVYRLAKNKLQEDNKITPYNSLSLIYELIRPFLTSDLQASFMDIINKSKDWR
jgi:hypothetical protein